MNFDTINYWSEIKLDIVQKYASAYSAILSNTHSVKEHVYIDAFAGAGIHISKETGEPIKGSPVNALEVQPPFKKFYLIDLDEEKIENLLQFTRDKREVKVYQGDCNEVLLKDVFPNVKYTDYRRGLCLLDPYGLHLNWEVMYTAGQMGSLEIFINFPVMDMNQNVLWHNPEKVDPKQAARMDAFWGDRSWNEVVYAQEQNLFNFDWKEKVAEPNVAIAKAFQERLKKVAGFSYVPEPIPMRNSKGATVYYLFFASQNKAGAKIVEEIFNKYRNVGKV